MKKLTDSEQGSVLPLIIGYAAVIITVIFVALNATSLYLGQKRLDDIADSAALAAADAYTVSEHDSGKVQLRLDSAEVKKQVTEFLHASRSTVTVVRADTPDGFSARVTLSDVWHPPLVSIFIPAGVSLHATSTSRTAVMN